MRTSYAAARQIMGDAAVSVIESSRCFPMFRFMELTFEAIPFDEVTLAAHAATHVLVPDPGSNIIAIRRNAPSTSFHFMERLRQTDGIWFGQAAFALRHEEPRWRLIRKDMVPNSAGKGLFEGRTDAFERGEVVPSARELVFATVLMHLARNEHLFRNRVLTNDQFIDMSGGALGPCISIDRWTGPPRSLVGIASAVAPLV